MAIITLTTDWGLKDYYVGAVKGAILSQLPEARIIDITHEVPPFDILKASYILKNSYINFPKGSIHVIAVNSQASADIAYLIVKYNDHYFIGADNGIFSLMLGGKPDKIVEISVKNDRSNHTFPSKDIFAQAACHLARGGTIEVIGTPKTNWEERIHHQPVTDKNIIKGNVIYIDSYENVITNINERLFDDIGQGRPFRIIFKTYYIDTICKSYNEVVHGERLALFNSTDNLELAINQGNAAGLLGLKISDMVRIEFEDIISVN